MEEVSKLESWHLEHWSRTLSLHTPLSLTLLTLVQHELRFASSSTSWFWNRHNDNLLAVRHLYSEEKERSIQVAVFVLNTEDVDDVLECVLNILDTDRCVLFSALEQSLWPAINTLLEKRRRAKVTLSRDVCFKFYDVSQCPFVESASRCDIIPKLDAILTNRPLPTGAVARVVRPDDHVDSEHVASFVARHWKFCNKFTLNQVRDQVERGLVCGVFVDDKIVSWMNVDENGFLSKMFTLVEHRGQGLALHVLRLGLAQGLKMAIPVLVFVEEDNVASFKLFSKVGFSMADQKVAFIFVDPNTDQQ